MGGKLYAIAAKVNKAQLNPGNALYFAEMAQSINDKAGVKTLLKELQKMIKPAEPEQQTAN